ncbi:MAG: immunoglobulin domain-containing protein, partial [Chlorobium sp.]
MIVVEGAMVQLIVSAIGSGTITFQWQKNGEDIPGATDWICTIPVALYADSGTTYRCVVTNEGGSTTSNEATLTVVEVGGLPPVLSAIGNRTVNEGGSVEFTVSASDPDSANLTFTHPTAAELSAAVPGATFVDHLNGTGTFSWTPGYTRGKLTPYLVRFEVSDDTLPAALTASENVSITVNNVLVSGIIYEKVSATETRPLEGAVVSVLNLSKTQTLASAVTDAGGIFYVISNTVSDGTYYIEASKSGYISYTGFGILRSSQNMAFTSTLSLSAQPPVVDPLGDVTVNEKETATFTVAATGTGTLRYQWKKNGADITGATSASYTTPALTMNDSGSKYSCAVTDDGGTTASNEATLTVSMNAPVIDVQPVGVSVKEGNPAEFSVVASGSGTISYQWLVNGEEIFGATDASCVTPAVTMFDSGSIYACIVRNEFAAVKSDDATLTVTARPPEITAQPMDLSVKVGQKVQFSVLVTGTEPLRYQWQKNLVDIAGATFGAYETPVVTMADNETKYCCVVTNDGGSITTREATLTVTMGPPAIIVQPLPVTVNEGG